MVFIFTNTFLHSQLLNDTFVDFYKKLECSSLVLREYERRALNPCLNIDGRRCRSIFCSFSKFRGADIPSIKIEKFNNALNSYEDAAEITFRKREFFEAIFLKKRLFVLGGSDSGGYSKCVSKIIEFDAITRMT